MSYHGDMHKKAEADLVVARKDMEARNMKHMEELAKIHPTPTPAELRKAMGVVEQKPVAVAKKEDEVEKTSAPAPADSKADYQTRSSNAKK